MRPSTRFCRVMLLIAACTALAVSRASGQDSLEIGGVTPIELWLEPVEQDIALASHLLQPAPSADPFRRQPVDPFRRQPTDPFRRQPVDIGAPRSLLDEMSSTGLDSQFDRALARRDPAPNQDVVSQRVVAPTAPTDLGSLLQKSSDVQTVNSQQRSPVSFDPHVRGYRFGEIYSQYGGEYFLPARLDLDSMLSKIDPYLMQTVSVIPGPYGVRYGPGMAFIDVVPLPTPRNEDGPCWNNRFYVMTRGNGSQIFGQDTLMLAAPTYGAIANYGLRTGADYFAGNGQRIPSSYHNQNEVLQLGRDVGEDGAVEVRYSRLDMWNTEYALQFFDVSSMQTDSYLMSYAGMDPASGAQTAAQVWYNQTAFRGNNLNASKNEIRTRVANGLNQDFNTNQFVASDFKGFVNGNLVSTGARYWRLYGDENDAYVRGGADVRYVTQSTREQFLIRDPGNFLVPDEESFSTNQPHSALTDPGLFAEWNRPWSPFFKTTIGTRVDWVNTHPRVSQYDDSPAAPGVSNVQYKQNDTLISGYLTGEMELMPEWTVRGGVGYAERVPDLVNRYADGIFLGILQNGFSRVVGRPNLEKERATQADVAVVADYDGVTGRASAFYSWINDYNTYTAFGVDPPTGAQILLATNTALATIKGFELYGDYQSSDVTTWFASLQYVQGSDRIIRRPLPQIYPLEGRVGIRWTDPEPTNDWGLEWGFRIVAQQNRIGFLRNSFAATTSVAVESPTAGFYTSYVRGYYNLTDRLHFTGGIDNMFDRTYLEHLDLRLQGPAQTPGGVTAVLAPGFTAYLGVEWLL